MTLDEARGKFNMLAKEISEDGFEVSSIALISCSAEGAKGSAYAGYNSHIIKKEIVANAQEPEHKPFKGTSPFNIPFTNCTYTNTEGEEMQLGVDGLLKIMEAIPKPPKILTMNLEVVTHSLVKGNTILISEDIADALDELMKS